VPFKEVLAGAIRRGLEADARRASGPYRCPTFRMGDVSGARNLDKALRLAAGLEDEETARELLRRK
jgi:hypothetical protein